MDKMYIVVIDPDDDNGIGSIHGYDDLKQAEEEFDSALFQDRSAALYQLIQLYDKSESTLYLYPDADED